MLKAIALLSERLIDGLVLGLLETMLLKAVHIAVRRCALHAEVVCAILAIGGHRLAALAAAASWRRLRRRRLQVGGW